MPADALGEWLEIARSRASPHLIDDRGVPDGCRSGAGSCGEGWQQDGERLLDGSRIADRFFTADEEELLDLIEEWGSSTLDSVMLRDAVEVKRGLQSSWSRCTALQIVLEEVELALADEQGLVPGLGDLLAGARRRLEVIRTSPVLGERRLVDPGLAELDDLRRQLRA